jgi:hypothetical protein
MIEPSMQQPSKLMFAFPRCGNLKFPSNRIE